LATAVRAVRGRPGFAVSILQPDFSGIDFYYFVQLYARPHKYGNSGAVGSKTDLLTRGAIHVHVIQDAIENEICSDDKDSGGHELSVPGKRGNRPSGFSSYR
jgi:hypothetical protein